MGKKRLLVSIALSSMLTAYDFNAQNFQSTQWNEFQRQETTSPYYVWTNQNNNGANPIGVGAGFVFRGNDIYFYKDATHINTNNINDIWIIGSSGNRYILLDFTQNTMRYDEIGLHFRGGSTTTRESQYVLLNTRYMGNNGTMERGIYFNPSSQYAQVMLNIIGYPNTTPANNGPCNTSTSVGCSPISDISTFIFRGTDVNDDILQRYYSHDFVFGTPLDSENFGTHIDHAQFKGSKIDFSGGYWDSNGSQATGGATNANLQSLVFNGADSITQNTIDFLIGSGETTLRFYNLGTKFFNFSNLSTTSNLRLDSVGSSIAGNILYANTSQNSATLPPNLNLIFANSASALNVISINGTTHALETLISPSSYLGGTYTNGSGNNASYANGIIGINDTAQVTFIGESSHRFGTSVSPNDSFSFIGSSDSSSLTSGTNNVVTQRTSNTNKILFLNGGNLNGSIFSTADQSATTPTQTPLYSKINFSLFGTSISNLTMQDTNGATPTTQNENTLNALFSSVTTQFSTTDSNLASYFATMNMQTSRLSGNAILGNYAKATLVFDGASTHDFSGGSTTITGGSTDSLLIFNNTTGTGAGNLNYSAISGFRGSVLSFNSTINTSSGTGLSTGSFQNYTHIFNGYGAALATQASIQGRSALNQILSVFNNASSGLANYDYNALTTTTTLNQNLITNQTQNTHFVFAGANSLGNGVDLSQANFNNVQYTFIDFGEINLENTTQYGNATIALAGNSWARGNISVAYTGTLDVSYANRNLAQSFFDNHLYGTTRKDVVLDFGGDFPDGRNYDRFHNGYIVEGTNDSTYIFSNLGGTLDLSKKASQGNYTASFDTNSDGLNDKTITLNTISDLQSSLIANGINLYVDSTTYQGATIGFRDTNIIGTLSDNSFGIDAVFNTSGNLIENTYTDSSGNKVSMVESGQTKSSSFQGTIGGDSKKRITFIGTNSFLRNYINPPTGQQGLSITGGTIDSQYNFYSVGEFTQDMVTNIINNGAKGSFSFEGDTSIYANIIKDTDTTQNSDTESINIGVNTANSTLTQFTQGVFLQGTLGGNITKNATFAGGSSVIINAGNSSSVYDFSLSGANGGALITTKLDFAESKRVNNGIINTGTNNTDYLHGTILGLEGLTSIAGTLSNTIKGTDSTSANQVRFTGNTNGVGGHWFVTESSSIDSLIVSNDSSLLTGGNIQNITSSNALAIVDLSTYDWQGYCHDGTTTCNTTHDTTQDYDYYLMTSRDLGAGFSKKTLTIAPSIMNNGTTYNSLFSSSNGVFRLGLNLLANGEKADEIKVILTQNMQGSGSRIQFIQSASTAQIYEYTGGEKVYVASVVDSTAANTATAPNFAIDDNAFRATEQYLGLGIFRTTLATDGNTLLDSTYFDNDPSLNDTQHWGKQWYIQSIHIENIDDVTLQTQVINPLEGAILAPYLNLYIETNNMAKRMGELRGANDPSGAWVKVIGGGLKGDSGYYAHNIGVQGGLDKKSEYNGSRVYWGFVGSFMNIWGNNSALNAQSSSFSLGFYRSALYANQSYLDIVGKYIYTNNTYNAQTLNFSGKDTSGVSSAYISAEYGRRLRFKNIRGFYIQPQAELIAGYIGSQNLRFENQLVTLSVDSHSSFALIGRVGTDVLQNFTLGRSAGYWRVGASLVGDFLNRGRLAIDDNVAHTDARSHTIGRDFRVVFNAGLDMRLSRNSRIYFEVDKSFFGNYNLDYIVSAGLRYNFGENPRKSAPQTYPNFYEQQYLDTYSYQILN